MDTSQLGGDDKARSSETKENVAAQGAHDHPNEQDSGDVIRKGRGQFHGPTGDIQDASSHTPRGRDFDATTLRQYPPKGDKIPKKTKKSKLDKNGQGDSASDHEGGGSDSEVNRLTSSLEQATITKEKAQEPAAPSTQDVAEDWEKAADAAEEKTKASPTEDGGEKSEPNKEDGKAADKSDPTKTDAQNPKPFKKGHKKSKSSKIEFNFDPDAYEGSTRILDVSEFPASFKTHNLHEIFDEYENMRGGYRIKWMDDTRALIIFEHPFTARKAYLDHVNHELAKIRPYEGPTDFLQKNPNANPRPRPQTTDMVARRMVHGALGVRVAKTPEQRQAERSLLQNARGD